MKKLMHLTYLKLFIQMLNDKTLKKIDFRNEKKIIFLESENFMIKLFKFLKFKEIYQKRKVNSIYFETFDFKDLLSTIDGEKNRSKLRIRWYGEIFNSYVQPVLENKIKVNNKNFKINHTLNQINFFNDITSEKISNLIENTVNIDERIKLKYKMRKPNVLISYERQYFMYNNIRITLDSKLFMLDFNRKKKIKLSTFIKKKKFSIVELKFIDKDFNDVAKITSNFKNRVMKFSKYEYSLIGA